MQSLRRPILVFIVLVFAHSSKLQCIYTFYDFFSKAFYIVYNKTKYREKYLDF